jgi:hypothetical protein
MAWPGRFAGGCRYQRIVAKEDEQSVRPVVLNDFDGSD